MCTLTVTSKHTQRLAITKLNVAHLFKVIFLNVNFFIKLSMDILLWTVITVLTYRLDIVLKFHRL